MIVAKRDEKMGAQTQTVRRQRGQILPGLVFFLTLGGTGSLGFLLAPAISQPQERDFTIVARKYAYEPAILRVNRGDRVRLRFAGYDVVHGFYLEGHDIDVKIYPMRPTVELYTGSSADEPELVEEVVFTADKEGKFRYRCSQTCGFLHPFMLGELIVEPNRLLPTSVGLALGVLLGGLLMVLVKGDRS